MKVGILAIPNDPGSNYVEKCSERLKKPSDSILTRWSYRLNRSWKEILDSQKPFPLYFYWQKTNIIPDNEDKRGKVVEVANVIDFVYNESGCRCPNEELIVETDRNCYPTDDRSRIMRTWFQVNKITPLPKMMDPWEFKRLDVTGVPITRRTMANYRNPNIHFIIVEKLDL
jgi:hypothetical protein